MSLPRDLDEIPETELLAELLLRAKRRADGLCDYCKRPRLCSPCKFPGRHRGGGK